MFELRRVYASSRGASEMVLTQYNDKDADDFLIFDVVWVEGGVASFSLMPLFPS